MISARVLSLAPLFALIWVTDAIAAELPIPPLPENVILQSDVEYGKAGERSLKLDLFLPKQPRETPLPVIVFIHGGAWEIGDKSDAQRHLPPYVASGNYIGASIGYRLTGEALWPAQLHDCKAAIRWLKANAKKYNIDPQRIGVWGASAGGQLANMLGTTGDLKELEGDCGSPGESTRVACVVDFCGPTDMRTQPDPPRHLKHLFGKPVEEVPEVAKAASPIAQITKGGPPFLIVHGTKDGNVPLIQAERFQVALGVAGTQATLIRIDGGAHNSPFNKEIEPAVQAFFDKHLRGIASPEPPKPNLREKVIIERDVEYGKAGDRSLVLDIVRPKEPAAGPLPVVAYFHGGGWNKWDKSTGVGGLVPIAATGNYFCVTVGYRLAKEALWPAQIHDCKASIRWLKANAKRLNIDPQRIAVWGGSSGGHLAAEVAVTGDLPDLEGDCGSPGQSTRVACCVDYTGPTDLRILWGGSIGYLFGGRAREMPEVYRQASPVAMVTKDAPPFLIVHGTADTSVPLMHATAFYDALKAAGADATLFLIDGGEHNAVDQPALVPVVLEFLDKRLRGK